MYMCVHLCVCLGACVYVSYISFNTNVCIMIASWFAICVMEVTIMAAIFKAMNIKFYPWMDRS